MWIELDSSRIKHPHRINMWQSIDVNFITWQMKITYKTAIAPYVFYLVQFCDYNHAYGYHDNDKLLPTYQGIPTLINKEIKRQYALWLDKKIEKEIFDG